MNTVCKIWVKQLQFHFIAVYVESTYLYLQYITKRHSYFITKLRKQVQYWFLFFRIKCSFFLIFDASNRLNALQPLYFKVAV